MNIGKNQLYEEIFLHRGHDYNMAMIQMPHVRNNEFNAIIDIIKPYCQNNNNIILVDIPSGGSYLKSYLPTNINYIGLEVTQFTSMQSSQITLWSNLPFNENSVDIVVCMTALHHLDEKGRLLFYGEVLRILKPNGIFIIADVILGSFVDKFLNIFVDKFNSMGHKGIFFNNNDIIKLQKKGFNKVNSVVKSYPWTFKTIEEMVNFVKLLFGLDLASNKDIEDNIGNYLDIKVNSTCVTFEWELMFIVANKGK